MNDILPHASLLPLALMVAFAGVGMPLLAERFGRSATAIASGAVMAIALALLFPLFSTVLAGQTVVMQLDWLPAFGFNLGFRLDGLGMLFSILILGIGLLIVLYAYYYLPQYDRLGRFYAFLLLFMSAMLGIVLSENLLLMVVFWEITSLSSFLLIAYKSEAHESRIAARMALAVTGGGGLALLAGVILLGQVAGSYELSAVIAAADQIKADPLYPVILTLVLLGAFTKSAQFPFHFWLPNAMAAPTPVSAYLHSATMVKAGVFLLARLYPALSGTDAWLISVSAIGAITLVYGAYMALHRDDFKGLLAYSTISHLGLITLLFGLSTPMSVVAGVFHIINHAIFKASLFMAAGIIDHESGTRDLRVLRGLRHKLPITATLAIVASAAMAGVPLLNGFLSKEMFFAETIHVGGDRNWWMSVAAVAMGMFSVAYSLRFISVFFGAPAQGLPRDPHEPPRWMRFPVELLVVTCLIVGIAPGISIEPLLHLAVVATLGQAAPAYDLAMWHGVNLPLLMSVFALGGGVLLYIVLRRHFDLQQREQVPVIYRFNGAQAYETVMLRITRSAEWLLGRIGTLRLQPQLFLMMLGVVTLPLVLAGPPPAWAILPQQDFDPLFAAMWVIGAGCALAAAWMAKYHRLAALTLVGGTGIVTAATFLWLSAPDLALTQLMVETVTTVLILLGLRWLPPRLESIAGAPQTLARVWARRTRDLGLAVGGGLTLAALTYAVLVHPIPDTISDFFLLHALDGGGGSNVVNVLLVDFRSFDTLGEITVLAIVALTVYALLRRFRPAPESAGVPPQQRFEGDPASRQSPAEQANSGYLLVPGIYLRLLLPFMGVIAVYFFMRGHNLPGGGFVAGLIFAVAILVQYMLAGTIWVESHIQLRPHRWLGFGLLLACFTGLGAWWFGHPFLTTHTAHVNWPWLGELHLPSAFVFDLGVFAVVVGTTMLMLVALAHQSLRAHRQPGEDAAEDDADTTTERTH